MRVPDIRVHLDTNDDNDDISALCCCPRSPEYIVIGTFLVLVFFGIGVWTGVSAYAR